LRTSSATIQKSLILRRKVATENVDEITPRADQPLPR
jgi:hypothetical protein